MHAMSLSALLVSSLFLGAFFGLAVLARQVRAQLHGAARVAAFVGIAVVVLLLLALGLYVYAYFQL